MTRIKNNTSAQPVRPTGMPLALSLPQGSSPYDMVEYSVTATEYHVYLSDEIDDPLEYVDLLASLRRAEPHDIFYIYLNTPGGRLDTGLQLINAMRDSRARVVTILDPQAYSMGALLFLSGKELIVPDNSMLMFHNYSSGLRGKGNEQLAEVQAASRSFEKVMRKICQPFLSATEIQKICNGQDLWLDSDDILKRLDRMNVAAQTEHPVPNGKPAKRTKAEAAPSKRPAARSRRKPAPAEDTQPALVPAE